MNLLVEPCTADDFRAICDQLVAKCPPPKGCKVHFQRVSAEDLGDALGDADKDGRTFTVRVIEGASLALTEYLALHEYAHVMCWRPFHPLQSDHDAVWGCTLAGMYCAYHGVT